MLILTSVKMKIAFCEQSHDEYWFLQVGWEYNSTQISKPQYMNTLYGDYTSVSVTNPHGWTMLCRQMHMRTHIIELLHTMAHGTNTCGWLIFCKNNMYR